MLLFLTSSLKLNIGKFTNLSLNYKTKDKQRNKTFNFDLQYIPTNHRLQANNVEYAQLASQQLPYFAACDLAIGLKPASLSEPPKVQQQP
jgi:hypothetical protein